MRIGIIRSLSLLALIALALVPAFATLAALVFLLAGTAVVVLSLNRSLAAMSSSAITLIPLYCIASVLWSDYPAVSARLGIFLALTIAIAISIGSHLSIQTIARFTFWSHLVPVVLSFAIGNISSSGPWSGIFSSKNMFAIYGLILLISGILALSIYKNIYMRTIVYASIVISIAVLIGAQSVGTLVSAFTTLIAYVTFMLLRKYEMSTRISLLLMAILASLVGVVLNELVGELLVQLIVSTGKDPTLTGRTDLWAKAIEYIGQNPVFGLGYRAFWVQGNPEAEELWRMFYIESRSGFHFHNTYLSNAVEIGLLGMALQLYVLWSISIRVLKLAFVQPQPILAWAAAFVFLVLTRSLVEVDVFSEFSAITFILVCIASSLEASGRQRRAIEENELARITDPASRLGGMVAHSGNTADVSPKAGV